MTELQHMKELRERKAACESIPTPARDIVVLANNPTEMVRAQQELTGWAEQKLAYEKHELVEAQTNLREAKEQGLKTSGWKHQVLKAQNRVHYYTKILEALRAGYAIVPDFPVELVAIRTDAKRLPSARHKWSRHVDNVKAKPLPVGSGGYASPLPALGVDHVLNEKKEWEERFYAEKLQPVDFPLRKLRPQVLAEFGAALAARIFDEIGILPATRRNPDPVVIGRVFRKECYNRKVTAFLITWWIDTRDL